MHLFTNINFLIAFVICFIALNLTVGEVIVKCCYYKHNYHNTEETQEDDRNNEN